MEIRLLNDEDFINHKNDIVNLLEQNYRINVPKAKLETSYFIEKFSQMYNYYKENRAIIYICVEKEICGLIWFFENYYLNEKRIHINEFIVGEKYRRLGLGTKLINKVIEYAKKKMIKKIDLYVTANNINAVKFYKNKDFEIERYMMSVDIGNVSTIKGHS